MDQVQTKNNEDVITFTTTWLSYNTNTKAITQIYKKLNTDKSP